MLSGLEKALLGILLIVLMTGMGATLTGADFKRVVSRPKGVMIGLASQFGWMPLIAFGLAQTMGLPQAFAIGLLIVGCTPGGTTSNLFTYYARADLSLSISMTVVSTIAAVVLMPLLLGVYVGQLDDVTMTIPYGSIVTTLVLILIPVALGMWIKKRSDRAAEITEKIGSLSGIGVLIVLVATSLMRSGHLLVETSAAMYASAIGLGLCGMGLGYLVARLLGLGGPQRRAVALETGIQNSPLAFGIILATFPESAQQELLWLPLLYALFVLISSSLVTLGFRATSGER